MFKTWPVRSLRRKIVLSGSVAALVGVAVVVFVSAAGVSAVPEPESGILTGQAKVVSSPLPSDPGGRSCPPLPAHPNASCTGVPPGTVLHDLPVTAGTSVQVDGVVVGYADGTAVQLTQDGSVLDSVHVAGDVVIRAANVTIKNSQIDGSITDEYDKFYGPYSVTDTTIGPANGCVTFPAMGQSNYTALRVQVRNHDNGFQISGPSHHVTIRDSFAKICSVGPGDADPVHSSHADGIQAFCADEPCYDLVLDHNTLDDTNISHTSPFYIIGGNGFSPTGVTGTGNLLVGGVYTMFIQWRQGPDWIMHDNSIVHKSWDYGPVDADNTCSHLDWSGNQLVTIDDNYNVTSVVAPQPCVD
jgi:hypothetical protein